MNAWWFSRIRLRPEGHVRTLAPLLLPVGGHSGDMLIARHRLIWALFADGPERRRDFLWREDRKGVFYILSARPPQDRHDLFVVESKPFEPRLKRGDRLHFVLRANAVVTRNGKRHDVVMDMLHRLDGKRAELREQCMQEAGEQWLCSQGERYGFELHRVIVEGYHQHQLPRRQAQPARFSTLDMRGTLSVTDPDAFLQRLTHGFGHARAFGCGLMLVKRG